MPTGYALIKPLIHALPPETAHKLGLQALRWKLLPSAPRVDSPLLNVHAFGLTFPNPVGLAAGFDKNATAIDALLHQGFGFVEAGTVTPKAQTGNPTPRLFRLSEDEAVINRMGFNNAGLEAFVQELSRSAHGGIIGANIGKNKDSESASADYVQGLQAVYAYADYITINISSPNTPGLRALQKREALKELLAELQHTQELLAASQKVSKPLLVKIAPDLDQREKEDIVELALTYGIAGLIVSNTTISRPALGSVHKDEQGGLSGKPLFALSTQSLKDIYRLTRGKIPLIGAGGIASAEDAYAKIRAGANLVQLYSALVYQGFGLVERINRGLITLLERDGFSNVSQAVGSDS